MKQKAFAALLAGIFVFNQAAFAAPRHNHPRVLLIQDIHLHAEAQRSIAETLQNLINKDEVGLVGVEGAFRPFDFSSFRNLADLKTRQAAADDFLRDKHISAPSYVGVTSPVSLPPFIGVDHQELYDANVEAYRQSVPNQKAILNQLEREEKTLRRIKFTVLNPQLQACDALLEDYEAGRVSLGEFLEKIPFTVQGVESQKFLRAYRLEKYLDIEQSRKEQTELIEQAAQKLKIEDVSKIKDIKALVKHAGVSLDDKPSLQAYLYYVSLSEQVDAEKLLSEVHAIQAEAVRRLARTPQEKRLISSSRMIVLEKKLVNFSMTPEEWSEYRGSSRIFELSEGEAQKSDLIPFMAFYALADMRSYVMAEKFLSSLPNEKTAVLIVGGFHSPLVKAALEKAGASVQIVRPHITKVDDGGSAYLSIFNREKSPLERLMEGKHLSVYPSDVNLSQPDGPDGALSAHIQDLISRATVVRVGDEEFSTNPRPDFRRIHFGRVWSGAGYSIQRATNILDVMIMAFQEFCMNHPHVVGLTLLASGIFYKCMLKTPAFEGNEAFVASMGVIVNPFDALWRESEHLHKAQKRAPRLASDPAQRDWFYQNFNLIGATIVEVADRMAIPSTLYDAVKFQMSETGMNGGEIDQVIEKWSQGTMAPELLHHIFEQSRKGPARTSVVAPLKEVGPWLWKVLEPLEKKIKMRLPDGKQVELRIWKFTPDDNIEFFYFELPKWDNPDMQEWLSRWVAGRGALALVQDNIIVEPEVLVLNGNGSIFGIPELVDDGMAKDPSVAKMTKIFRAHGNGTENFLPSELLQLGLNPRYVTIQSEAGSALNVQGFDFPAFVRNDKEGTGQVLSYESRGHDLSFDQSSYRVDLTRLLMLLTDGTYTISDPYHNDLVSRPTLRDVASLVFASGPAVLKNDDLTVSMRRWGAKPYSGVEGAVNFISSIVGMNRQAQMEFQKGMRVGAEYAKRLPEKIAALEKFEIGPNPMVWKYNPSLYPKGSRPLLQADLWLKTLHEVLDLISALGHAGHWSLLYHFYHNRSEANAEGNVGNLPHPDNFIGRLRRIVKQMREGSAMDHELATILESLIQQIDDREHKMVLEQKRFDLKRNNMWLERGTHSSKYHDLGILMGHVHHSQMAVIHAVWTLHGLLKGLKKNTLAVVALPALMGVVPGEIIAIIAGVGMALWVGSTLLKRRKSPQAAENTALSGGKAWGLGAFGRTQGQAQPVPEPVVQPEPKDELNGLKGLKTHRRAA